jgi:hypothetical protein
LADASASVIAVTAGVTNRPSSTCHATAVVRAGASATARVWCEQIPGPTGSPPPVSRTGQRSAAPVSGQPHRSAAPVSGQPHRSTAPVSRTGQPHRSAAPVSRTSQPHRSAPVNRNYLSATRSLELRDAARPTSSSRRHAEHVCSTRPRDASDSVRLVQKEE